MRLAHFSDIHVTLPPLSQPLASLLGKRVAGTCNYYLGGRNRHFAGVEPRITTLLTDMDGQAVHHALCTGDVTAMSLPAEFERGAALFGERMKQPGRFTVLPGNHDRYTEQACRERTFEQWFGNLAGPGFPFLKQLPQGVMLVGMDTSRPTSLLDSSGLCSSQQLKATTDILTDPSLDDGFVILALHYSFLRPDGRPETHSHGLRDHAQFMEMLALPDVHVDLILHGHAHGPFRQEAAGRPVICSGSATDLHHGCGYNLYDIDVEQRSFSVQRRRWNAARGDYEPDRPPT